MWLKTKLRPSSDGRHRQVRSAKAKPATDGAKLRAVIAGVYIGVPDSDRLCPLSLIAYALAYASCWSSTGVPL